MRHLAIAAIALALATPALAAPIAGPTETRTISVSPAGLDLSNSRDAASMAARLDRAALNVCGSSRFGARDHQDAVRRTSCYRDALAPALNALSAPAVAEALGARP